MTHDNYISTTYTIAIPGCIYGVNHYAYLRVLLCGDDYCNWMITERINDNAIVLIIASGISEYPEYSYCITTDCNNQLSVGWINNDELIHIEGVQY